MKLLLDMNISPKLVDLLCSWRIEATHWVDIGQPNASDVEIMDYAYQNGYTVVTYDLDFSAILSVTQVKKPSVVQIRKQGLELFVLAEVLAFAVSHWKSDLEDGAVLTLDAKRARVRLLPLVQA